MTARPKMQARDSSGRKVSLLNDEPASQETIVSHQNSTYSAYDLPSMVRSESAMSRTSSPLTPDLVRADSFDSNNTNDPLSPITPTSLKDFDRQAAHGGYKGQAHFDYREGLPRMDDYSSHQYGLPAPTPYSIHRTSYPEAHLYDEEPYQNRNLPERGPKRYPCRHRDTHNCEKTFTTSGHASRHSKIHTAEKGVLCIWKGCQKKFTRGDNMKQHLETHTKDRSRTSSTMKATSISSRALTMPSGVRKSRSIDGRSSRPSSRNTNPSAELPPVDPAILYQQQPVFSSHGPPTPAYYGQPTTSRRESLSSGLDALAAIAADSQYRL